MNKRLAFSCAAAAWLALGGFEAKLHAQSPADQVSSSTGVVIKNFIPDMDVARRLEEAKEKSLQAAKEAKEKSLQAAKASKAASSSTSATKHAASEQNSLPPLASHLKASKSDTPKEVVNLDKKADKKTPAAKPAEKTTKDQAKAPDAKAKETAKTAQAKAKEPAKTPDSKTGKTDKTALAAAKSAKPAKTPEAPAAAAKTPKSAKYDIVSAGPGRKAMIEITDAEKPGNQPKEGGVPASKSDSKHVSVEGRLVAKRPGPDATLHITVKDLDGELIRGVIHPAPGMRVPMEGAPVRVSGTRLWDTKRGSVVEVEEIVTVTRGRLAGRERRELLVTSPAPVPGPVRGPAPMPLAPLPPAREVPPPYGPVVW